MTAQEGRGLTTGGAADRDLSRRDPSPDDGDRTIPWWKLAGVVEDVTQPRRRFVPESSSPRGPPRSRRAERQHDVTGGEGVVVGHDPPESSIALEMPSLAADESLGESMLGNDAGAVGREEIEGRPLAGPGEDLVHVLGSSVRESMQIVGGMGQVVHHRRTQPGHGDRVRASSPTFEQALGRIEQRNIVATLDERSSDARAVDSTTDDEPFEVRHGVRQRRVHTCWINAIVLQNV